MMCGHARELMAGAWTGEIDASDETKLKQHLSECAECGAEMTSLSAMWDRLADLPAPEPGNALNVRWQATLDSIIAAEMPHGVRPRPGKANPDRRSWFARLWPSQPLWQAGVAFACLVAGVALGAALFQPKRDAEIARLHDEISTTREMVALSLLRQESASERLKGVDYTGSLRTMEPQVVSALVQAVDHDPSVNVRLAAIDALNKASNRNQVVDSLAQSLTRQDSPMVQAALVDYFIETRSHQALGAIRQLASEPDVNPAVLERTRYAIQQLSR